MIKYLKELGYTLPRDLPQYEHLKSLMKREDNLMTTVHMMDGSKPSAHYFMGGGSESSVD